MKFYNVATSSWFTKMHFAGLSRYGWYASAVSVCTHTLTHTYNIHAQHSSIHTLRKNICMYTNTCKQHYTHTKHTYTYNTDTLTHTTHTQTPHMCTKSDPIATGSSRPQVPRATLRALMHECHAGWYASANWLNVHARTRSSHRHGHHPRATGTRAPPSSQGQ